MFFLFLILSSIFFHTVLAGPFQGVRKFNDLPEIEHNEKCVPGESYRNSCNTCKCGKDNVLLCTKMSCNNDDWKLKLKPTGLRKQKSLNDLPPLPQSSCQPGKMYKYEGGNGCSTCFCDHNGTPECDATGCNVALHEDSDFPMKDEKDLPVLHNLGSKCEPGRKYKIDCNSCVCKHDGNLRCTKRYCLHVGFFNKQEALKQSGQPCKKGYEAENDCVRCSCEAGLLNCNAVPDCVYSPNTVLRSGSPNVKLAIKPAHDRCIPGMVYKSDCNKCFCQHGSLRCTIMKCLNYQQSLKLQHNLKLLQSKSASVHV